LKIGAGAVATFTALLTVFETTLSAQGFLLHTGAAATTGVTPLPPSVDFDYQSSNHSGNLITDLSTSSSLSHFVASGDTARGAAVAFGSASASFFNLSVSGTAWAEYPNLDPNSVAGSQTFGFGSTSRAGASAGIILEDLIFNGSGTTVSGSLNLFSTELINSAINIQIIEPNYNSDGTFDTGNLVYTATGESILTFSEPGSINTSASYGDFHLPLGVHLRLSIEIQGYSEVEVSYGQTPRSSNFSGELRWADGDDIFNLPDGYTVNSLSAGIVNNRFTAIPEPHEYSMMAAMLAVALVGIRKACSQSKV